MEQSGVDIQLARLRESIISLYGDDGAAAMREVDERIDAQIRDGNERMKRMRPILEAEARAYDASRGDLTNCLECNGKGYKAVVHDTGWSVRECRCMAALRAKEHMQRSGLAHVLDEYTLDSFLEDTREARAMKNTALAFLSADKGWLYAGGQVGAGKTHICTAVCGELLRRGQEVRYMLWKDESARLKALINEPEGMDELAKYKLCQVLYIDDLLKPTGGNDITAADLKLLFEIINSRYAGRRRTIISSERRLEDLIDIDQATGSRIYQMSRDFWIDIEPGVGKNRRLM